MTAAIRAAKFAVEFERGSPEPGSVANRHAADSIDHRQRRDFDPACRCRGRRADTALQIGHGGTEAGADAAEGERGARRAGGGIAEIPVGRETAPMLVAAVQEVEADRAGDDGYHGVAYPEAATLLGKPGLHTAAG